MSRPIWTRLASVTVCASCQRFVHIRLLPCVINDVIACEGSDMVCAMFGGDSAGEVV